MPSTATEAAVNGYTFLKEHGAEFGLDVSRLNPDTLDLASGCDCALAQAFGADGYWAAIEALASSFPVTTQDMAIGISLDEAEQRATVLWERLHGFTLKSGVEPYDYAQLTEAWRMVIKSNRDQQTVTA